MGGWWLPGYIPGCPGGACHWVVDWPSAECVDDHQAGHSHHTHPATQPLNLTTPKNLTVTINLTLSLAKTHTIKAQVLIFVRLFFLVLRPSLTDRNRQPVNRDFSFVLFGVIGWWGEQGWKDLSPIDHGVEGLFEGERFDDLLVVPLWPTSLRKAISSFLIWKRSISQSPCWTWARWRG